MTGRMYEKGGKVPDWVFNMCADIFKVNSNTMDKSNDIKQLREQIRKLDEHLDCEIQVLYATANVQSCQTSCVLTRAFCT